MCWSASVSLCFAAAQLAAAALLWRRNTHHDRLYLLVVAPIIAQELSQMAVWLQPSVTAWSFAYYVFSTLTTPCFCLLGLLVSTGASGRRRQLLQAVLAVSGLGWLLCSWLCATSLWDAIALRVGSCGHLAFHIPPAHPTQRLFTSAFALTNQAPYVVLAFAVQDERRFHWTPAGPAVIGLGSWGALALYASVAGCSPGEAGTVWCWFCSSLCLWFYVERRLYRRLVDPSFHPITPQKQGGKGPAAAAAAPARGGRSGTLVPLLLATMLVGGTAQAQAPQQEGSCDGELLYNNICLPKQWPPRRQHITRDPSTPPYLTQPPPAINISLGRQLFVDDLLIAELHGVEIEFHEANYVEASNPVLAATLPHESEWHGNPASKWSPPGSGYAGFAVPEHGGVWYDEHSGDGLPWRMIYSGADLKTCLATSKDGLVWEKPKLDVVPGTNIVVQPPPVEPGASWNGLSASSVWFDASRNSSKDRWWGLFMPSGYDHKTFSNHFLLMSSRTGIHWEQRLNSTAGELQGLSRLEDASTIFHNPFRGVWVYSIKAECFNEVSA